MTKFASKFDVVTHDPHPNALAGLMVVLEPYPLPSPLRNTEGTPNPGTFEPGMVVMMNGDGKATLGIAPDTTAANPILPFVTVDGDWDLDGAAVHRLTCIQGGLEIQTEKYTPDVAGFTPGEALTFGIATAGLFEKRGATNQIYGFVGPRGEYAVDGVDVLDVIIPQGVIAD
jgi:uncharacterized protein YaiE (UPF0345 family)